VKICLTEKLKTQNKNEILEPNYFRHEVPSEEFC